MPTTQQIIHNGKELYPNLTKEEYMKIEWVERRDLIWTMRILESFIDENSNYWTEHRKRIIDEIRDNGVRR